VSAGTIQYRVAFGKKDEVVEGPDGAALVIEVPATEAPKDPAVSFMQGKLRATGDTGLLFERLKSGEIAAALARLSQRP
jgi:hypothetical protein